MRSDSDIRSDSDEERLGRGATRLSDGDAPAAGPAPSLQAPFARRLGRRRAVSGHFHAVFGYFGAVLGIFSRFSGNFRSLGVFRRCGGEVGGEPLYADG